MPQIWRACQPNKDVLDGTFIVSELALDLYAVARGKASPPYDNPVSFFNATEITPAIGSLIQDIMGRLAGSKKTVNPVLVFDVGFGGGKTHAMAALFYAARDGKIPEVKHFLGDVPIPEKQPTIVAISGDEYGGKGVLRGDQWIKTLWGDFFYQLGEHKLAVSSDNVKGVPNRESLAKLLSDRPTLILLDELPKYLNFVKDDPKLLDKVKHFIHALSLAVCDPECRKSVLIVSIAGDVYDDAAAEVRRELRSAMDILGRKMQTYEPVRREDVPGVLRKRLFSKVDSDAAKNVAEACIRLSESIHAPDRFRRAEFKNRIIDVYPFHPELIDVLYERVATIPEFQRTRGALRLLSHAIFKIWQDKEQDAYLVQPFHIDLASEGVVKELTSRLKEDKFKNAIDSDVFSLGGRKAKAQNLDTEYAAHFGFPLFRRACSTIYLYTLTGAKLEAKGIDSETLVAISTTIGHEEQAQWYRERVLGSLRTFWYIEPVGDRFFFAKEAGPTKVIDQEAMNVPLTQVRRSLEGVLQRLFTSKDTGYFYMYFFPDDPGAVPDDTLLKIVVLNPLLGHSVISEDHVSDQVSSFILNRDSRGGLRRFKNGTFILAAREGSWSSLRETISRLEAARAVSKDPEKYGIGQDRKKQIKETEAKCEDTAYDAVRAAFTYLVYVTRGGRVEAKAFRANGYSSGESGQDMLWRVLSDVLSRIKNEPLDPEYVKIEVASDLKETTSKELFERIHSKPGAILPKDQSLFEKTIQKGVEQGIWVLLQGAHVYTPEDLPSHVIVSSDAQLLSPEEAGRRGITDVRGHKCKNCLNWPCICVAQPCQPGQHWDTVQKKCIDDSTEPLREWETFELMTPSSQLEELDRWVRSEGVEFLSDAEITARGSSELIPQFKNFVTLSSAGRSLSPKIRLTLDSQDPNMKLHCDFECNEKGLEQPAAKVLDDAARWHIPEFEGTVSLKADRFKVSDLKTLLQTLKSQEPGTKLALKLKRAG